MEVNTLNCNTWVDKYTDYLFSFAYYKVGKKEEAEDLVQDTFLSAYKGRETYNGIASEKTWLMAILKNKIIDYYRKPKITDSFSTYLDQTEESFESSFFDKDKSGRWTEEINENYFFKSSRWIPYQQRVPALFKHLLGENATQIKSSFRFKIPRR